ncbi:MAG: DAK2 domain-containing protein [Verrucomicrobiales bacterium]
MSYTSQDIEAWLGQCADRMIAAASELNELDGRLGDGDLGATLEKCARLMRDALAVPSATPSDVFKACAIACTRASGSSFGTLMAVAFMTLAKSTVGKVALDPADVPPLLVQIIDALMARGRGTLGDKTLLDSLEAIRLAAAATPDPKSLHAQSLAAALQALDDFRVRPNLIGRARMFGEKSIGLDDPGMVAVARILGAPRA